MGVADVAHSVVDRKVRGVGDDNHFILPSFMPCKLTRYVLEVERDGNMYT